MATDVRVCVSVCTTEGSLGSVPPAAGSRSASRTPGWPTEAVPGSAPGAGCFCKRFMGLGIDDVNLRSVPQCAPPMPAPSACPEFVRRVPAPSACPEFAPKWPRECARCGPPSPETPTCLCPNDVLKPLPLTDNPDQTLRQRPLMMPLLLRALPQPLRPRGTAWPLAELAPGHTATARIPKGRAR